MTIRSTVLVLIGIATVIYFALNSIISSDVITFIFGINYNTELLDGYLSQENETDRLLIIDTSVLNALSKGKLLIFEQPLKVAVERSFDNEFEAVNETLLEIIYYDKPADRDYWMFLDSDGTRRAMLPLVDSYLIEEAVECFDILIRKLHPCIDQFMQDWSYSRFIDCANVINRPSYVERQIPLTFISHFAELRDFIKNQDNAYLVACGGTLLSELFIVSSRWYRECSIIPHTTDVDFFIRSEEFSRKILASLKSRSPFKLFRIYGLPDDSYELSVWVRNVRPRVNIDIFSLYTTYASWFRSESWMGGLEWSSRKKFKWSYPKTTEFCTGDLLNHLIYVPCDVEAFLEEDYGNWKRDRDSESYVWFKSAKNVAPNGKFTEKEMRLMKPEW